MTANFWMIVSNADNFRRTQDLGFTVQGLKLQQKRKLQRVGPGDRVLFYVSGIRRFTATALGKSHVGALAGTETGRPHLAVVERGPPRSADRWSHDPFPSRRSPGYARRVPARVVL